MSCLVHHAAVALAAREILRLRRRAGTTIVCEAGGVWVTQEGLLRDDFLCAGEALRVTSTGLVLIEPTGAQPARLALCDCAAATLSPSWKKAPV